MSFEYKYYEAPTSEEQLQILEEEMIALEFKHAVMVSNSEDVTELETLIAAKRTAFTDAGGTLPE